MSHSILAIHIFYKEKKKRVNKEIGISTARSAKSCQLKEKKKTAALILSTK